MMKAVIQKFWNWYNRHETANTGLAAVLFTLQIIHLIWLSGDVVYFRTFGDKIFNLQYHHGEVGLAEGLILLVDYLEIPAILTTSLVYLNELQKKFNYKSLSFLFFINSQWLHIFWITDEFVVETFTGADAGTVLPFWLAWAAILIDYLELPVIYDTIRKFINSVRNRGVQAAFEVVKEKE